MNDDIEDFRLRVINCLLASNWKDEAQEVNDATPERIQNLMNNYGNAQIAAYVVVKHRHPW